MKKYTLIIIGTLVVLAGCRRLNPFAEQQLVAQVGDERLYLSDVAEIFTTRLSEQDSLRVLRQFVDAWVVRQLKMRQSERLFRGDQPEIDEQVENYRASLLTHKVDQYYVDARLDTALTDDALKEYYDAHKQDFPLDRALVRGIIVRMPANHPRVRQLRSLIDTGSDERHQDFLELSRKNNFEVHEMTEWTNFTDFLKMLPTNSLRDYDQMLDRAGLQEMRDGGDLYLIVVSASLKRGEPAPFELVRPDVQRLLLNQRRESIIRAAEDSLYKAAVARKELKVNVNKKE